MSPRSNETPAPASENRTLNGRHVVLAMFAFGLLMVAALWLYWELYTRPFRQLQEAIHAEFPQSSPRVIGGQHKRHKGNSPRLLRIVVRIEFDPNDVDADADLIDRYITRLRALASAHADLTDYDELEIHLVRRVPEQETQQRVFRFPLSPSGG